ncbi:hypothetical protein P3S68_020100 [Capsicum galapagoense]
MVEEINDPLFGMHIFNIRPFKYLIDQVNVDENELFDVVDEIVGHGAIQSHKQNDKISVFMNVELQDHELNSIEATFGGDFVEQITPCLDGSNTAPVVVVMQFIRAHKFQDKYSIHNTWHASKLWVNPDLPQVVDFKISLIGVRGDNTLRVSQISTQRSYFVSDELLSGDVEDKTIAQLVECLHEGNFWMYATIFHIEMENGWSYMGRKRCPKKVKKIRNKFHCKKCDRMGHSAAHRYKLQVRVMDGTDFISLFLWDREATKLIGKSATQLKGQIDKTTDFDNDDAYPVEIDTILDKNALFKVAIKIHNVEHVEVYTVLKICDDEELTKQFRPSSNDDDFPDPNFNCEKVATETHEITDSNPDNDLNTLTNTMAKRSLLEIESLGIEIEDDPNAQLSSTKLNKVVKKEKLA